MVSVCRLENQNFSSEETSRKGRVESPRYPTSNLLSHSRPQLPRGETAAEPHFIHFIHPIPRAFSVYLCRVYTSGSEKGESKGTIEYEQFQKPLCDPRPSAEVEIRSICLFSGTLEYPHGSPLADEVRPPSAKIPANQYESRGLRLSFP